MIGMDINGMDGTQDIGQYQNVRIFVQKIRIVIDLHLEQRIYTVVGAWDVEHLQIIIQVIVQLLQIDINQTIGDGGVQVIFGEVKYMIRRGRSQRKICNI